MCTGPRLPKIILISPPGTTLTFCASHGKTRLDTQTDPTTMSDTEMGGGVALGVTSPTQSQLADEINGGAMDVHSVADSTISSRL